MAPDIHNALVYGGKLPPDKTRRKAFQNFMERPICTLPDIHARKELACISHA